jgi:hypothetical protein
MTQNQTAARKLTLASLVEAMERREALREALVALDYEVKQLGEAFTALNAVVPDDDADADAYFKAQGEDYRDEDYASLARDEAYASGAWSS